MAHLCHRFTLRPCGARLPREKRMPSKVARTYREKGAREAWKLMAMGKRLSRDGRRMCPKIEGDFVFTALPVLGN